MSEGENFLSRWSRRKLEAEHDAAEPQRTEGATAPAPAREAGSGEPEKAERQDKRDEQDDETFDVSTLPSLDSITAETDIRVFLQKGVPAQLTRAALRRAWAADPTIRDFIEMAENQWDFVTGSDLPGFGPLNVTPDEVRRMVANAFGELQKPAESEAAGPAETPADTMPSTLESPPGRQEIAAAEQAQPSPEEPPARRNEDVVQRNEVNVAMQQSNRDEEYKPLPTRRPHGRALPQ
jgi:hypothetical protein